MLEPALRSEGDQVTPGLVGHTALEAIESCRQTYKERVDVNACIDKTLQLNDIVLPR
jgi:hypothetical protein